MDIPKLVQLKPCCIKETPSNYRYFYDVSKLSRCKKLIGGKQVPEGPKILYRAPKKPPNGNAVTSVFLLNIYYLLDDHSLVYLVPESTC